MPSRGLAFKKEEVNYLLEVMADILPISSMEWEDVERRHNERFSTNERTKETLKRKFQNLYLKRVPTGDPTIPPEVRWAKKIQNDIKQRADISEGEDTDGDDEAEEEYVDEPQEGTEDDVQQDALDDAVLLTPMVATAAARRPKSNSSVFKAPMLRVGTRSQVDPFENVMKYIMKKDLELKIVKQEDDKRREREREERRNDEERRYQLMFMQAQQAQQQTNAILQHLVNMSNTTTYPTYPNNNPTTLSSNNNNYPVIDLFTTTGTTGTVYYLPEEVSATPILSDVVATVEVSVCHVIFVCSSRVVCNIFLNNVNALVYCFEHDTQPCIIKDYYRFLPLSC